MELEQPATDSEQVEQPAEDEIVTNEGEELEGQTQEPAEPEVEEVDYEGEKFKVPAKLKDALLRQADYTRKTQEVAEIRKAVEADKETVAKQAQFQQENAQAIGHLVFARNRMAQIQQALPTIHQQDPVQAQALQIELSNLQATERQIDGHLTQRFQQKQWAEQQETAKQLHDAAAFIQREIKDWSPAKDAQLEAFAKSKGVDTKELSTLIRKSPAVMVILDMAAKFDQFTKSQAAKPKPERQEAPVSRVGAVKATSVVNPDKLSPEQWVKWRNAQLRKS